MEIPAALTPFTWASTAPSASAPTSAAADHAGISGVQPPPGWRHIPAWPGPIPAWPDSGHPQPWWWMVGLHGGAGVSTLVAAMPQSGDARRALPRGDNHQSPYAVVVARTHHTGLEHARDFARQAVCGLIPPTATVLGLVLVADAEKRPDASTRRFARIVASAYPRSWRIPWIPEWRHTRPDPALGPLPEPVTRLARDLAELTGLSTRH